MSMCHRKIVDLNNNRPLKHRKTRKKRVASMLPPAISCVLREIVVTEIHEMLKSLLASYATVIWLEFSYTASRLILVNVRKSTSEMQHQNVQFSFAL